MKQSVNILGTEYLIKEIKESEDSIKGCDGYCDKTTKEIVVHIFEKDENTVKNIEIYRKKVLRHEIVHAFLFESGLSENSLESEAWATNEEMVDWIAAQGVKIYKSWEEAGAI